MCTITSANPREGLGDRPVRPASVPRLVVRAVMGMCTDYVYGVNTLCPYSSGPTTGVGGVRSDLTADLRTHTHIHTHMGDVSRVDGHHTYMAVSLCLLPMHRPTRHCLLLAVFSLAYLRLVGPTSLQYRIPFKVGMEITQTI